MVTTADMQPIAQASTMRHCGLIYGTSETLLTRGCSLFLRRNYAIHAGFIYNTLKAQALRETRAHGRHRGALKGAFDSVDWALGFEQGSGDAEQVGYGECHGNECFSACKLLILRLGSHQGWGFSGEWARVGRYWRGCG